uniref:Uncharacterized protein n=1 Tax=Glossina palpalis gambiensis TaxID=67801 RepID=A0A1B0C3C9_9MUSC
TFLVRSSTLSQICYGFLFGFGVLFKSPEWNQNAIGIVVFELGGVCGISAGMLLVDMPNSRLAGIASGVIFYKPIVKADTIGSAIFMPVRAVSRRVVLAEQVITSGEKISGSICIIEVANNMPAAKHNISDMIKGKRARLYSGITAGSMLTPKLPKLKINIEATFSEFPEDVAFNTFNCGHTAAFHSENLLVYEDDGKYELINLMCNECSVTLCLKTNQILKWKMLEEKAIPTVSSMWQTDASNRDLTREIRSDI